MRFLAEHCIVEALVQTHVSPWRSSSPILGSKFGMWNFAWLKCVYSEYVRCCRAFRINVIRDVYEEWMIGAALLCLFDSFLLFLSDVIVCCQQGRMLINTIIEWESARSMVQRMRIHHFDSPVTRRSSRSFSVYEKKVSYITSDDCCEWCFVRQRQPTTDGRMMGQRGLVRFEKWQKHDFTNTHRTRVIVMKWWNFQKRDSKNKSWRDPI